MAYHAFISYSHAADGRLAPALHAGLHRFAKPWYRLRALHVFRDETTLHPTWGLWESIRAALDRSGYFVLLASPDAAASPWVEREIAYWLDTHPVQKTLIVLTDGEIAWDPTAGAFDPARTTALPAPLMHAFAGEPLWLDLRWARTESDLSLRHPRFRDAVAELAAALHGRSKDALVGEDVRQHRRTQRIAWSAVAALGTLTVVSAVAARVAVQQRNEADTQRAAAVEQSRIALARQLAAQSSSVRLQFPDRLPVATLLALESTRLYESFEGNQALRAALALLPRLVRSFSYDPFGQGRVRSLAFSPDGILLAAARDDGVTELFHLHDGRAVGTLQPDPDPIVLDLVPEDYAPADTQNRTEQTAVAFGPDGRILATAGNDGIARVWETASGRELLRIEIAGRIDTVALSPDGNRLAVGSDDGRARVFAAADGRALAALDATADVHHHEIEHDEEVRAVAFSPDGRYLAAVSTDGGITLSRADTGEVHRAWYAGTSGLGLAFSADGRRLATANNDFGFVWDVETGEELFRGTHAPSRDDIGNFDFSVDAVALTPDGDYLATAGRDNTARVWDVAARQELIRLAHTAPVASIAFGPGGTTLSTGSYDGTARLWELPSGRERLRATHPGGAEVVVFSPEGSQVASGGTDGDIHVWSLDRGDWVASTTHRDEVAVVAVAPDGATVATADGAELRVWSAEGTMHLALRDVVYGAQALAFSGDGRLLAGSARQPYLFTIDWASGAAASALATFRDIGDRLLGPRYIVAEAHDYRSVRVWEAGSGRELPPVEAPGVQNIALDPTGTALAIRQTDEHGTGTLRLRALGDGADVGQLPVDTSRGSEFAVHPGGRLLAISVAEPQAGGRGNDYFVEVWDAGASHRLARVPQDDVVAFVGFDRSGTRLLTIAGNFAVQQRQVEVWDWARERLQARLTHEEQISRLRFGGDGDVVATASAGRAYIWGLARGELLAQIADAGYVRDLRFGPDGRFLLTGGADGTAAIWLWRTEDLRAEACRRLTRNLTMAEWQQYLGTLAYEETCPGLPDATPVPAPAAEDSR